MNWGIVAKIDLAEIRAPFIWTAAAILGVGLALALVGAFLFRYFTDPLMKQLEESRQRFERAVRGTSDGLWEWNIRTNEIWRAPRFSELLGHADGELPPTYDAWESRLHPEDRDRARQALRVHLEQNQPYDIEFRLRTKSGDYRWFRAHGQAERDQDGKPIRMAGSIQDITERKQAQAELERLSSFPEENPHPVFELDRHGAVRYSNPAAEALFRQFDLSPDRHYRVLPRDLSAIVDSCVREQRDLRGVEHAIEGRTLSWAFHPVLETDLVHAYGQDVTEHKRAEEQLRKLSRAVEQSPAAVVITDTQGTIEYVNPKFVEVTGYVADEVIGQNPRILKSGEMPSEVYKRMWKAISSGKEWRGEFHNKKKNGELYWELASISAIRNSEGQITHYLAVKEDITERKRLEQELRLSEARTRAILDHAADGIITVNERGVLESLNVAAEQIFGYAADELLGKNINLLMPAPHSDEHDGYLRSYLNGDPKKVIGIRRELVGQRKDGSTFPMELHVCEVQHDGCRIFAGFVRDLSRRKQLEQARIDHLQLEQERNHLQEAVQAHVKVLGVVGHELRTPLASVRAMAEFLLKEEVRGTTEADTFLQSIHDEVIRMAGMVNDLLEVARMNSGAARWNWSEVRVARACDDAIETVSRLIDRDKVALAVIVDPPDLRMTGDAEAIRRLLVNLLNNAHKHTAEGSIRVQASEMYRDNHCWVKLQVSDSGEGIPPEIAKRLGMPFALNSGIVGETHVQGSGLGLAICRGIVAAHGGAISVETVPGQGTSVTILLRADLPEPALGQEPTEITCEVQK